MKKFNICISFCLFFISSTISYAQSTGNYTSTKSIKDAICGLNNGKIEVIFDHDTPTGFRWQNSVGQTVGDDSRILDQMPPGAYDLFIRNTIGNWSFMQQYSIGNQQGVAINLTSSGIVTDDQCGQNMGRIQAPSVSSTIVPTYLWKHEDGSTAGTGPLLENVSSGNYTLTISHASACAEHVIPYTVGNAVGNLISPVVNDVKICAAGNATIQVLQPSSGTYVLYGKNGTRLTENTGGVFNVQANLSQNYTVTQRVGNCESPAATVNVTIENEGLTQIANTFSPNGDGINDYWLVPDLANYPKAFVSVFNRHGAKVFESAGYSKPFDGKQGGQELSVGTYFYIIDLKRDCGLIKGSLTIIR